MGVNAYADSAEVEMVNKLLDHANIFHVWKIVTEPRLCYLGIKPFCWPCLCPKFLFVVFLVCCHRNFEQYTITQLSFLLQTN